MNEITYFKKLIFNREYLKFHQEINYSFRNNKINNYIYNKLSAFCFLQQKNFAKSIEHYLLILNDKLIDFDDYLNLAVSYGNNFDIKNAIIYFEKSIEINPKFEDTYALYSKILINNNKNYQAYHLLKNRCPIQDSLKLTAILISSSIELGDYFFSIQQLNKLIKKQKANYVAYNNLGFCFDSINESLLAKKNYEKSITLKPSYPDPYLNLANLLSNEGNFAGANEVFNKCLKFNEFKPTAYRLMSLIHKFKEEDDALLTSLKLLEQEKDNIIYKNNFYELYFALSKAYEDLGQKKNFHKYLALGNKRKRKLLHSSLIKHDIQYINYIKSTFNYKWMKNLNFKQKDAKIIFITGMPRSGTTLVEQIISSHSKVVSGGELVYLPKIVKQGLIQIDNENFLDTFKAEIKNNFDLISSFYLEQTSYLYNCKKEFLTDKLPSNFLYIGLIKSIFSNCKIIHCYRNPMDNCFSIYKNLFPSDGLPFAYDQKDLAEYYAKYQELMEHWKSIFPNQIHDLSYEQLVRNKERETRRLLDYCSLDWEENCLQHHKNKSKVKTLSTSQARRPVYQSSIESWKPHKEELYELYNTLEKLNVI